MGIQPFAFAEEVYEPVIAGRRSELDEYKAAFQAQGRLRRRQIKRRTRSKVKYVRAKTSARGTKSSHLSGAIFLFSGLFLLRISSR